MSSSASIYKSSGLSELVYIEVSALSNCIFFSPGIYKSPVNLASPSFSNLNNSVAVESVPPFNTSKCPVPLLLPSHKAIL